MDKPAEPVEVHKKDIDEEKANGVDNPGIDRDTRLMSFFVVLDTMDILTCLMWFWTLWTCLRVYIFLQPLTCQMNHRRTKGNPGWRLRVSNLRLL